MYIINRNNKKFLAIFFLILIYVFQLSAASFEHYDDDVRRAKTESLVSGWTHEILEQGKTALTLGFKRLPGNDDIHHAYIVFEMPSYHKREERYIIDVRGVHLGTDGEEGYYYSAGNPYTVLYGGGGTKIFQEPASVALGKFYRSKKIIRDDRTIQEEEIAPPYTKFMSFLVDTEVAFRVYEGIEDDVRSIAFSTSGLNFFPWGKKKHNCCTYACKLLCDCGIDVSCFLENWIRNHANLQGAAKKIKGKHVKSY